MYGVKLLFLICVIPLASSHLPQLDSELACIGTSEWSLYKVNCCLPKTLSRFAAILVFQYIVAESCCIP